MRTFDNIDALSGAVGENLGESRWIIVDQPTIDQFADATGDDQWIHVDPVRAASGPFGATVAHGYLTLALLARLLPDLFEVNGIAMAVNYGLNKVRFPAPVPSGSRIRATATIADVAETDTGAQLTLAATIQVEGSSKPACVAESVIRLYR